jgi:hypothetical protein
MITRRASNQKYLRVDIVINIAVIFNNLAGRLADQREDGRARPRQRRQGRTGVGEDYMSVDVLRVIEYPRRVLQT